MFKLDLKIHKSREHVVVAHFAVASNTYLSIVFVNIVGRCSFTSCFQDGKTHNLQLRCITKWCRKRFSITNNGMYPFAMIKTRSSKNLFSLGHSYDRVCENQKRMWWLMDELCFISWASYDHPHTFLQLPICIIPN